MIFKETTLVGAYLIEEERIEDERGFFTRSYCDREFEGHGLQWPFGVSVISEKDAAYPHYSPDSQVWAS